MTPTRTVLLAPDKFKGTLSAAQVVEALRLGIARTAPELQVLSCPIADGGDGTVDAALAAGFTEHSATVTGPTGAPRIARWALQDGVAVLELAETVGLQALPGGMLAPGTASTRGLGELIRAAVSAGAHTVLVGLGGSSSTDAGAGLLQGLGAHLLTEDGTAISGGLNALPTLARADLAPALEALEGVTLIAANDVTNPLLGTEGAAAVYGPQKGLAPHEVETADAALAAAAGILDPSGTHRDRAGAGAAGGTGFGLFLLGARQRSGADAVFELVGVDALLEQVDVVVTGDAALDCRPSRAKAPPRWRAVHSSEGCRSRRSPEPSPSAPPSWTMPVSRKRGISRRSPGHHASRSRTERNCWSRWVAASARGPRRHGAYGHAPTPDCAARPDRHPEHDCMHSPLP